jgi:hypothetical protein
MEMFYIPVGNDSYNHKSTRSLQEAVLNLSKLLYYQNNTALLKENYNNNTVDVTNLLQRYSSLSWLFNSILRYQDPQRNYG